MGISGLILAAGAGRRLGAVDRPKVLVEVNGQPLLVRLLRQLEALGAAQVAIAVGAYASLVRDTVTSLGLSMAVEFVENDAYATTNNSYTLHLCRSQLARGGLLIEGDVIADELVLREVIDAVPEDVWAVRSPGEIADGAFLEANATGTLRALTIVRSGEPPRGSYKSTGILKLSPRLGCALGEWLDTEVKTRRDRYYDLVLAEHFEQAAMHMLVIDRGRWLEIDSQADLASAETLFSS